MHDLEGEVARLTLRIKDLQQQLWGRKAERGLGATGDDAAALSLFAAADGTLPAALPEAVVAGLTAPSVRRAGGAVRPGPKPLDPALARELIALPDPPAADRRCPVTGAPLVPGFAERLEVLARRAPTYFVKRYERTVWVSPAKSAPVATPWPTDVLPRARMHVSVVAHLAAAHYSEHLPFYRIEQQLARTGVTLARSTQVALVAPLVAHLKRAVLDSGYVHLDATPVDVCDPARPGRAREATLWAYRARSADPAVEGLVWCEYQPSKSPTHPRAVLAAYRGVLQTDGAAGLDALWAPNAVTHVGCWAHTIRTQSTKGPAGLGTGGGRRAREAPVGRRRAERDDMTDLQGIVADDDAFDDQLQDRLALVESGGVQSRPDPLGERR
ncbi:MAG TPA: transposase [Gemmatirosa sp.]